MKKILFLILVSLSGCALIDAYNLKYDVMEYNQITEIRTLAQQSKSKCGDPLSAVGSAISLSTKTLTFANYTQYRSDKPTAAAAVKLNEIAHGLSDKFENDAVSPMFCKIKFEEVEKSAETMQKTIGAKP
jgi:hypothetical protein